MKNKWIYLLTFGESYASTRYHAFYNKIDSYVYVSNLHSTEFYTELVTIYYKYENGALIDMPYLSRLPSIIKKKLPKDIIMYDRKKLTKDSFLNRINEIILYSI